MMEPQALATDSTVVGQWNVRIDGRDVTFVRGYPITIASMTSSDPFGPNEATLSFPMVSPLEPIGLPGSELSWMRPDVPVKITWKTTDDTIVSVLNNLGIPTSYTWTGFTVAFDWQSGAQDTGVTVTCVGALRVLDNIQTQPKSLERPITFETSIVYAMNTAIRRSGAPLNLMSGIDFSKYQMWWPSDLYYHDRDWKDEKEFMRPAFVADGSPWTGLLTRSVGSWEKTLTGFVASQLGSMYTKRGRFTIDVIPGSNTPTFVHRDMFTYADQRHILRLNAAWPGVQLDLSADSSQTLTTVYGKATSVYDGSTYTGEQWIGSGNDSYFQPFASRDKPGFRREVFTEFENGIGPYEARLVAQDHLRMFSEPGITGTITLTHTDPLIYDSYTWDPGGSFGNSAGGELIIFPKQLISAGMSIELDGFLGNKGLRMFIADVQHSVDSNTSTLTVDTKYRDYVTLNEVAVRGLDSMQPIHQLNPGKYPQRPELMLPWSSAAGSGIIPANSKPLWDEWFSDGVSMPTTASQNSAFIEFPWTEMTTAFPPKNPKYRKMYLRIPASKNGRGTRAKPVTTEEFWSHYDGATNKGKITRHNGLSILSGVGTGEAFKFVCVDEDGVPLPVSYHVSIWGGKSASAASNTPLIKEEYKGPGRCYKAGSAYPMYPLAWEEYNPDGSITEDQERSRTAGMLVGFGTGYEPAGYWPYSYQTSDPSTPNAKARKTGMMVYNTQFTWDFVSGKQGDTAWIPTDPSKNKYNKNATVQVLVFCDDKPGVDKYFIGRVYSRDLGYGNTGIGG